MFPHPRTVAVNAKEETWPITKYSHFVTFHPSPLLTAARARVRKTLWPFPVRPLRLRVKPVQQVHNTARSLQYTSPERMSSVTDA